MYYSTEAAVAERNYETADSAEAAVPGFLCQARGNNQIEDVLVGFSVGQNRL